jgi:hypothetical protein
MLKFTFAAIMACMVAEVQPRSRLAPSEPAGTTAMSMTDVLGQWDVVSFEGHTPARKSGSTRVAFADFDERGVRLRIECNHSGVNGSGQGGRFVAVPGHRAQTEMGCGKEREQRDSRYFAFFLQSPRIERLGPARLRLSAGKSILILERPAQRRLAFVPEKSTIQGTWRMNELTRFEPGGGFTGTGLSDVPGSIVIKGNRLSYDRCSRYDLSFDYAADGRLMKRGDSPLPENLDCSSLRYRDYDAPALPSAMEIIPLLHSNPWIEDLGNGRLLIANDRVGLTLSRSTKKR